MQNWSCVPWRSAAARFCLDLLFFPFLDRADRLPQLLQRGLAGVGSHDRHGAFIVAATLQIHHLAQFGQLLLHQCLHVAAYLRQGDDPPRSARRGAVSLTEIVLGDGVRREISLLSGKNIAARFRGDVLQRAQESGSVRLPPPSPGRSCPGCAFALRH